MIRYEPRLADLRRDPWRLSPPMPLLIRCSSHSSSPASRSPALQALGFAANLVPALGEQGASPASSAVLGALMGVMQLPGACLAHERDERGITGAAGCGESAASRRRLAAVGLASSTFRVRGATPRRRRPRRRRRPHLIQTMFADRGAGYLNGRLQILQQCAPPIPSTCAGCGGIVGTRSVFGVIAAAFSLLALASPRVLSRSGSGRAFVPAPR